VVGCVRVAVLNVARSWVVLVDGRGISLSTIALGRVRIAMRRGTLPSLVN
jgi:hypothetical protein